MKLVLTIKFLNFETLLNFVNDYNDLAAKLRIVIHTESKTKETETIYTALETAISTRIFSTVPILVYLGQVASQDSSKKPLKKGVKAVKYFQEKIYSKPIKHNLIFYTQNKSELLDFCVPPVPLFALRMYHPSPPRRQF